MMDTNSSFRSTASGIPPNMVVTPSFTFPSSSSSSSSFPFASSTSSKLQSLQSTLAALDYEKEKRIQAEQRVYELRQKLAASVTIDSTGNKNKGSGSVLVMPPILPTVATVPNSISNSNVSLFPSLLFPSSSSSSSIAATTSSTTTIPNVRSSVSSVTANTEEKFSNDNSRQQDQPTLPSASTTASFSSSSSSLPTTDSSSSLAPSSSAITTLSASALVPIERSNTIIANLLPTNTELAFSSLSDKVRSQSSTIDQLERQTTIERSSKETLQIENNQLKKEIEQLKAKLNDETKGAVSVLRQNELHSTETIQRLESHVTALGKQLVTVQAEAGSNAALAEERQNRITNLVARLEVARKEAETADTEVRKMQSIVVGLETRIQRSETNVQSLENERNSLKQRLADTAIEINDLRRSVATVSSLNVSSTDNNEQKLRFEHQLAIAETRALTLEREVIGLRESRSNLLATMREADANLERLSITVEQAEERETSVRKELANVLGERARIVAELTARATQAEKDNVGVRTRLDTMISQVTEAERRVTQYAERLTTVEHQYNDLQSILSSTRAELSSRTTEIDSLHEQINTMATDNELLRSRYHELQQQYQQQQLLILTNQNNNNSSDSNHHPSVTNGTTTTIIPSKLSQNPNEISDPLELLHKSSVLTVKPSSAFAPTESTKPRTEHTTNATSSSNSTVPKSMVTENLATTTMEGPLAAYLPKKIKQQHESPSTVPQSSIVSSLSSPRSVLSSSHSTSHHPHHATLQVIQANHRRVNGALTAVLFAGPQFADRLRTVKKLIEENTTKQIIIALITSGTKSAGQFAGIYTVNENNDNNTNNNKHKEGFGSTEPLPSPSSSSQLHLATRIYGHGPLTIFPSMIHTLFKYDTVTREFRDIGFTIMNNTLPVSTDAVGIDPSWISVAKREKRTETKV